MGLGEDSQQGHQLLLDTNVFDMDSSHQLRNDIQPRINTNDIDTVLHGLAHFIERAIGEEQSQQSQQVLKNKRVGGRGGQRNSIKETVGSRSEMLCQIAKSIVAICLLVVLHAIEVEHTKLVVCLAVLRTELRRFIQQSVNVLDDGLIEVVLELIQSPLGQTKSAFDLIHIQRIRGNTYLQSGLNILKLSTSTSLVG